VKIDLSGKAALVTGGGQGIGLGIAEGLAECGARVVVADLDPSGAVAARDDGSIVGLEVDLGVAGGPEEAVATTRRELGGIDILANNVGICIPRDGFLSVDDDGWEKLFQVNLMSAVRASRAAIPVMIEAGGGAVITTASESGLQPAPVFSDYAVTKGSLHILTKLLANEFSRQGVRCNSVTPGPIRTPAWGPGGVVDKLSKEWGMDLEEGIDHFVKEVRKMPLGKIGEPADVAAMVCFLASDLAKQITGSDFRVDGGQIATIV
jgi:NAD(P)-dependent dehydrogenase (short-subunit alcohol dehydrogenase family)